MRGGIFWLSSYPKSGNTWTRCLVTSLMNGGEAPDFSRVATLCPTSVDRPWLERLTSAPSTDMTPAELRRLRAAAHRAAAQGDTPAFLKVHDVFEPSLFPAEITRGVVLIVRDPRGVAPSFAAHLGRTLDQTIDRMANRDLTFARFDGSYRRQLEQRLDSWSGHANSWLDWRDAPRLLLKYEELSAEPVAQARRLADFLEIAADDALIEKAVRACRFEALQAAEARDGFYEKPPTLETFFRRGEAHSWRDELTPAQEARILADHSETMRRLGYLEG